MKKGLLLLTFYKRTYRENRGDQIRGRRPNPLADSVPHAGPNPLADLVRGDTKSAGDQIHGGPNPQGHRNNIPLSPGDELTPLFRDIFSDSDIAAKYSSRRTKTMCIVNAAIAPHFNSKRIL